MQARSRRRGLAAISACLVLLIRVARSEDVTPGSPLMLAVVINGRDTGLLGTFQQRGAALLATREELRAIGLRPPAGDAGDSAVEALSDLPGIRYVVDGRRQLVQITAAPASLVPTEIGRAAGGPVLAAAQSDTGGVLNYNVVATGAGGHAVVQGQLDARIFSPFGVASTGLIAQGGRAVGVRSVTRLDSTYSYSDPDTLRRFRVGDVITGGLAWTRPIRLGGLQVTTDFSLRADLVTFPVPTIAGTVAVPSSVDVLVNGVQLLSRDVPPGPFELRQLPVVTGAGSVSVAITDALGQQVTQTLPFYASNTMLARGLSAFSAELGSVRTAYGVLSDAYRSVAGSGSYRRGLADWLTAEAHAEASPAVANGGAGASVAAAGLGVLSFSAAFSTAHGRGGGLAYAGFERISAGFSLTASVQVASAGYRDLAASLGDTAPRLTARAGAGWSLGRAGAFGIQFTMIRRNALSLDVRRASFAAGYADFRTSPVYALAPAARTTLLSASYSRSVLNDRAFLYVSAFADVSQRHSMGAVVGISIPLGGRDAVAASGTTGGGQSFGTVQASRSAADIGDYGYQLASSVGRPVRETGDLQYRSEAALLDVGVDRAAGQTAYRASAQGAVVAAAGRLFAANAIYDSFAVVDTSGVPGIHVLQENRPAGQTDGSGMRLVTNLRSFEANRLDIDARDVPPDASLATPTQIVRPQDRSGVVVHFPLQQTQGALLRLVDAAGKPLAVGSRAVLRATGSATTVGFDGEAFVTGLAESNLLTVTRQDGAACAVRFAFRPHPGSLATLGPLACLDKAAS